ncbi:enoyl-CoA hydratase [Chachezhania sediminis]|uniref:enoyl-CoA hydratase n=1 Tax=Chachezhania sediminis TaxID=2599291 RepID=UPI00131E791C|nr:enoyl-CoA hydratase [Chachezhania sediminis]
MSELARIPLEPEADGYTPQVVATVEDGVGWLTFANPRRKNAVTYAMWCQIPAAFADFAADPAVKVIALRGEGEGSFISGADISEFGRRRSTPEQVAEYDRVGAQANAAIVRSPKPTVAVARTWCVGGGMGTALSCDLRIAAANTRFAVPAARLGLGYRYAGIKALVDVVGPAHAREIFFTARKYSAEEALTMGLINRILPVEGFDQAAAAYLAEIAGNAPLTIKAARMAIRAVTQDPDARDLDAIDAAIQACFDSEDYKEGRAAFAEKRAPHFRGR